LTVGEIIEPLEAVAPLDWQENYDNSGLLTGNPQAECHGALLSLDCTLQVIEEAIRLGCNLVISHHPLIFRPLKKISGKDAAGAALIKAIQHDIALYACHTNLDNAWGGVNALIADKLALVSRRVLSPKSGFLRKLVTFVPPSHHGQLLDSLFTAGAGAIGEYDSCSFNVKGEGTFKGSQQTKPFLGKPGELSRENEIRIEVVYEAAREAKVIEALKGNHPYEEPAYDIYPLGNLYFRAGSGMLGELSQARSEEDFLEQVKQTFAAKRIRHSSLCGRKVSKVAVCGGSGAFLIGDAIRAGADAYITGDIKYHDYFEADGRILLIDAGHYETEQFTPEIFNNLIRRKFPTFAIHFSEVRTNPINYL
jgi:dinuclear metal center YbgI/SA1388 family protein